MEQLDREMQKRVWQRVQSREKQEMPPLKEDNLKGLMQLALENSASYQGLLRQLNGRDGEQLRRLHQESQRCVACMKGICRMRGEKSNPKNVPVPKETARKGLEKCYHRERRLWEGCAQRAGEPEQGVVFDRLSRQAQEHCVTILEILGRME